jgi:hypothetical protein
MTWLFGAATLEIYALVPTDVHLVQLHLVQLQYQPQVQAIRIKVTYQP